MKSFSSGFFAIGNLTERLFPFASFNFSPFLSLHFSEVYVVDYRYFKANIVDLIRENKITDLIFAHSSLIMNRRYTISREKTILGKYRYNIKKDTIKKDSVKIIPKDSLINDSIIKDTVENK